METQTIVEYELVDILQDRSFVTDSREEAIAYYEDGWIVFEHHITTCVLSVDASTKQTVSQRWLQHPYPES